MSESTDIERMKMVRNGLLSDIKNYTEEIKNARREIAKLNRLIREANQPSLEGL